MPYLPPLLSEDTVFPKPLGRDFALQVKMIEDQYRLHFPTLHYEILVKATTPVLKQPDNSVLPSGEPGTTQWDPLWGERVHAPNGKWEQPHGTGGVVKAVAVETWEVAPAVKARVQRVNQERELKRYGFDKNRELMVFFACSLLDANGIVVQVGDRFKWHQQYFVIKEAHGDGYWQNTDIALYIVAAADHWREGA